MEVFDSENLSLTWKTCMISTKESHQFQFLVHQDSPHYLGRKLGCGREYSLLGHSAGALGCLGLSLACAI